MPNLYIIAGFNGAGKTTASFTVLPEMLKCQESSTLMKLTKDYPLLKLIKTKIERNLDLVISRNGKVLHVDPKKYQK